MSLFFCFVGEIVCKVGIHGAVMRGIDIYFMQGSGVYDMLVRSDVGVLECYETRGYSYFFGVNDKNDYIKANRIEI